MVNCRIRQLSRNQNEGGETLEELSKRCCGISILEDVRNLKGYDHEQSAPKQICSVQEAAPCNVQKSLPSSIILHFWERRVRKETKATPLPPPATTTMKCPQFSKYETLQVVAANWNSFVKKTSMTSSSSHVCCSSISLYYIPVRKTSR